MFDNHEIRLVAQKAVDILASHGLVSCLFGSAGCALYGCSRTPNVRLSALIVLLYD